MRYHLVILISLFVLTMARPAAAQEVLTLEDALEQARQNNYAIQQTRNLLAIAENDASIANAGFLPTVSVSANRNQTLTNTQQQFIGEEDPQTIRGALSSQYGAGAGVSWTVFDGMGRFATLRRLGAEREAASYSMERAVDDVLAQVTVGYYSVVRHAQQIRVLEQAVDVSQERLEIAELRFDLGSAAELEVRQAQVDLNADRAALLRQEVELIDAKAHLNRLLTRPSAHDFTVADTIRLDDDLVFDGLEAAAEERYPLLQQARQERIAAELEQQEIRAERLPSVGLNVGYDYLNLSSESGFQQAAQNHAFSYGLSVSLNVFDGLNRRRRAQNAAIRMRNAELAVMDIQAALESELRSQHTNLQNRGALVALEEDNLEVARLNVDVALERFRLGTISSIELREVQETLTQAESRLLTALFEAKVAETELRRLAGRIGTDP